MRRGTIRILFTLLSSKLLYLTGRPEWRLRRRSSTKSSTFTPANSSLFFQTHDRGYIRKGIHHNINAICSELNAAVFKAVVNTILDQKSDFAICRSTSGRLVLEASIRDIFQRSVEDDYVARSFAPHAIRHVDKSLDDWQGTTNLERTADRLSSRWNMSQKSLSRSQGYTWRRLLHDIHGPHPALVTQAVMSPAVHIPFEPLTLTLPVCWIHCLASHAEKSWIRSIPRVIPLEEHELFIRLFASQVV